MSAGLRYDAQMTLRTRKLLLFTLASVLMATNGATSFGAINPVAGKGCPTVNKKISYKGVNFICSKTGKKLVWAVVKKAASKPLPTPTPTQSPLGTSMPAPTPESTSMPAPTSTPSPLSPYELVWSKAVKEVQGNLPATNPKITAEYIIEPGVLPENQRKIHEQVEQLVKDYSGYWFGIDHITIVEEATQAWGLANIPKLSPGNQRLIDDMKVTLIKQNPDSPDCKSNGAGGGFSISYLDHPVLVLNILNCPLGNQIPAAHEITHSVQTWMVKKYVAEDANPGCFGPSWLREGQAQAGEMTLAYWDGKAQGVLAYKEILMAIDDPSSKSDYLAYLEQNDPKLQQYNLGALASLYLIEKYGWKKSMDLWSESAQLSGHCGNDLYLNNFATVFQKIYGFSTQDFYKEVTPYLQYLYDNKVEVAYNVDAQPQPAGTVRIQLNESCHAANTQASLQQQVNGAWSDLAAKLGDVKSTCAGMYLPWTYAKVDLGATLRWHVYAPGVWDWYSTPYTYKA